MTYPIKETPISEQSFSLISNSLSNLRLLDLRVFYIGTIILYPFKQIAKPCQWIYSRCKRSKVLIPGVFNDPGRIYSKHYNRASNFNDLIKIAYRSAELALPEVNYEIDKDEKEEVIYQYLVLRLFTGAALEKTSEDECRVVFNLHGVSLESSEAVVLKDYLEKIPSIYFKYLEALVLEKFMPEDSLDLRIAKRMIKDPTPDTHASYIFIAYSFIKSIALSITAKRFVI